jgi:hypothetical protein
MAQEVSIVTDIFYTPRKELCDRLSIAFLPRYKKLDLIKKLYTSNDDKYFIQRFEEIYNLPILELRRRCQERHIPFDSKVAKRSLITRLL